MVTSPGPLCRSPFFWGLGSVQLKVEFPRGASCFLKKNEFPPSWRFVPLGVGGKIRRSYGVDTSREGYDRVQFLCLPPESLSPSGPKLSDGQGEGTSLRWNLSGPSAWPRPRFWVGYHHLGFSEPAVGSRRWGLLVGGDTMAIGSSGLLGRYYQCSCGILGGLGWVRVSLQQERTHLLRPVRAIR